VQSTFNKAISSFSPDFILYDAGVDISEHDSLGKLKVTDSGIYERDYWVLSECVKRKIPVAAVIGGGYDKNLQALAFRHSLLHRAVININDQVSNGWKLRFKK
jgi:acetoin utilization deacetylase AcuC-like enzyme